MRNDDYQSPDYSHDPPSPSAAPEDDALSQILRDIMDDPAEPDQTQAAPDGPEDTAAPDGPEDTAENDQEPEAYPDSGAYRSFVGYREYRSFDTVLPEASPSEWYAYSQEDQELDDAAEQPPEEPRPRRQHPILNGVAHALLVFLTVFSAAYLVAIYSDIPVVAKVRTMYIQSAMNTLNHKWMATAFIPGDVIDDVLRAQYESDAAMVGKESNWGAVNIQELPRLESETIQSPQPAQQSVEDSEELVSQAATNEALFYSVFWELDQDSFRAYLDENPSVLDDGWGALNINEAGLDDSGTSIQTIYGDQVLAIDAADGVILIRVWLSENKSRGVLAICKDTSRLSLCPASTLGVIGQTASRICDENGGVLAIGGSAFIDPEGVGNGGEISGLAVCSGEVLGSRLMGDSKRLEVRDDNRMYIMDSASELGQGTRDACEFQPAMIVDGEIMDTTWNGFEPRTALGQSEKLETMMLILEGRYTDSMGCGVEYVAEKMRQYGCVQAMNLDGGTSAIMYYQGESVTRCSNPDLPYGRTLPTAWVYKAAS